MNHSHPKWPAAFVAQMRSLLGGEYDAFIESLSQSPPVSIRLNPLKPSAIKGEHVPWCATGYYLAKRPSFTLDPIFHAGGYYVQEASSMFLEQAITAVMDKPLVALDLCAAPGGKSTHLRSLLPDDALLVCNEVVRKRIPALTHNMAKWGHAGHVVTSQASSAFTGWHGIFDLVLCDAPCSGEGLFRKTPDAISHWSELAVDACAKRQRDILKDVWPSIRPGGLLLYSTCTFNSHENEEVLQWATETLGAQAGEWPETVPDGPVRSGRFAAYRLFPHRISGEGFFIGCLRKKGISHDVPVVSQAKSFPGPPGEVMNKISEWIIEPGRFSFICSGDDIFMIHRSHEVIIGSMEGFSPVSMGTRVAVLRNGITRPSPELALSVHLNTKAFPVLELDRDQALEYLRGGTRFSIDVPDGYCLMAFENLPMGFSKKTSGRFNNMYPKSWYIRKAR